MDLGAMLAGKRVLVTGASSGLGENFARLVAGCKAKVALGARRKARLEQLAAELQALGAPQVTVLDMDVASEDSIDAAFAAIDASGDLLDVVVNNAGVSNDGASLTLPTAKFDELMAINVRGVWLVAVRAARRGAALEGCRPRRRHRQHRVDPGRARDAWHHALLELEGRGRAHDEEPRARVGAPRHPRQRHLAPILFRYEAPVSADAAGAAPRRDDAR